MKSTMSIPAGWETELGPETHKPYFDDLCKRLTEERSHDVIFPPEQDVFNALRLTSFNSVKVLILGQDPYHDNDQAHGLAFSVRPGVPVPPSLRNIYKELNKDIGFRIPNNGCLVPWAEQGVLLLNSTLTVKAHHAGSHQNIGWSRFTDRVIDLLSSRSRPVVFVLWGNHAQGKIPLIDAVRNLVIIGPHPSPLSAYRGFFGSRPFSRINNFLETSGSPPIDWQIPDL